MGSVGSQAILHKWPEKAISVLTSGAVDDDCTIPVRAPREDDPGQVLGDKWAAQVGKAVYELHRISGVWGDANPDDVLMDEENNAWITNFDDGYTHGWLDADKGGNSGRRYERPKADNGIHI
ncbi:hypothetical protein MAC_09406 [Metarhizium acridum CQMa 102]|uniref:Uncharacterized protein n=1 Tax=Metarhizium acridum (strain CQMa 102) TaxID=655827 RepID=E9EHQ8_METAQ|nr:uncharacterized protein MAC_09406 [Metarhizium acridum CQMa 102]EFY84560.1 hypothetical protein MAC_09406 [Metarhizium acridum CQMa 102]